MLILGLNQVTKKLEAIKLGIDYFLFGTLSWLYDSRGNIELYLKDVKHAMM